MSEPTPPPNPEPKASPAPTSNDQPKVAPETLELRAQPPPIARINRILLLGAAFAGLLMLAGLVIVALKPPTFSKLVPSELYNTDHNAPPEGLSKMPATYEGLAGPKQPGTAAAAPATTADAPFGTEGQRNQAQPDAERLARLDQQARDSGVFFRLQPATALRSDKPMAGVGDGVAPSSVPRPQTAQLSQAIGLPRSSGDGSPLSDAVDQSAKLAFLKSAPNAAVINPHRLQAPASPYMVMAGSIIQAALVTGLNSDLPGFVIAQVTQSTFDTATGRYLLIPQGTRVVGNYDSVVAFGQERALIVWQRLILPDGTSIEIDNLPAIDTSGYAGLRDEVDLHTWSLLKGITLSTVLGIGNALALGANANTSDLVKALRDSTAQTTNRAGQRLVERDLNVQPTLTVRPGFELGIIVHKDLILQPFGLAGLRPTCPSPQGGSSCP